MEEPSAGEDFPKRSAGSMPRQSKRMTVTTAAVPAALVPKFPGQNAPNPCICLAGFCGGTFSLRSGCYIIAAFLVFINFLGLAFHAFGSSFIWSDPMNMASIADSSPDGLRKLLHYTFGDTLFRLLLLLGQFFYFTSGILLAVGAGMLHPILCFAASLAHMLGFVLELAQMIVLSRLIANGRAIDKEQAARLQIQYWTIYIVRALLMGYFLTCITSFFIQVKRREYVWPMPLLPTTATPQAANKSSIAS